MSPWGSGFKTRSGGREILDLADTAMTVEAQIDRAERLTMREIRGLLMERTEEILRSLGSVPVLGPSLEDARPVDTRAFVRSVAPHLRMN